MLAVPPRGRPRAFDRDAALDTAVHLFWERGYEGTSLADLTAAMGINAPSFYAAFGNKEALFREAVERYGQLFGHPPAHGGTAREIVEHWLRDTAREYVVAGRPRGCLVVLAALTCTDRNRAVREFLAAKRRDALAALAAALRATAEEDLDVPAAVRFYGTVLHGLAIEARDGAVQADLDAVIDAALSVWPRFRRGG